MKDLVLSFYEQLVNEYHLIFNDWKTDALEQGKILDRLIRVQMGTWPLTVLDCSCGIGTQSIGLAARGYRVHATDLCPTVLARAEREAGALGLVITFGVADMRRLETQVEGQFDVVMTCDNVLAHFLNDQDLGQAAHSMWTKIKPGGLFLASLRDYDQIVATCPQTIPYVDGPEILNDADGRRLVFQVWDWAAEERCYLAHHFIVREVGEEWRVSHHITRFKAVLRAEIDRALEQAGLVEVRWHMPEESGYYQPIVTARKQ